jgi:hypothetical protein
MSNDHYLEVGKLTTIDAEGDDEEGLMLMPN